MKIMVPIVIWGAGGHAKVVTEILELDGGWVIAGYLDGVDPERWRTAFEGYPILGGLEALAELRQRRVGHIALAIGDNQARRRAGEAAQAMGFELVTAIHPHAYVSAKAVLGKGVVCAAGSVVGPASVVSEGVIVNTGAIVDHDCKLGSYSHIAPGAKLAGNVEVGAGAWIGLGAAVLEKMRIGEMTMIGAGAVVTKNIPSGMVAFGVPATVRRTTTDVCLI